MKKLILLFAIAAVSFSCKKEDPIEPNTTPTPAPTFTATKGFAINYTNIPSQYTGYMYVFLNGDLIDQGGNIGSPNGVPGAVYFTFDVDVQYHLEFSAGTSHQYKADVKFDNSGNMTEDYVDPTNTVTWSTATATGGSVVVVFQ